MLWRQLAGVQRHRDILIGINMLCHHTAMQHRWRPKLPQGVRAGAASLARAARAVEDSGPAGPRQRARDAGISTVEASCA